MNENKLEPKFRKSPVPQKYESIEAGALKLEFGDRVKLRDILDKSITQEWELDKAEFEKRSKLVNGE